MNKKLLGILSAILGCSIIVIVSITQNNPKEETESILPKDTINELLSNISVENEYVTKSFDTQEELSEYMDEINTIKDIEEAKDFLKKFYIDAANNIPEITISYYDTEVRADALYYGALPILDIDNVFQYNINTDEMVIKEMEHGYEVTYTLEVYRHDGTLIEKINRKDNIILTKFLSQISIIEYSSTTINE